MASEHNYEWWRADALLPAFVVVGPYFFNKLIYIYFPGYLVFVATEPPGGNTSALAEAFGGPGMLSAASSDLHERHRYEKEQL
jgi:hypothetical protein